MPLSRAHPWLKFCATFFALFLACSVVHYLARPSIAPFLNRTVNAQVSAAVINVITPSAAVQASGESLGAGNAYVRIAMGCDGVDVVLMLIVAVLSYPMSRRRKCLGALLGTLLIYAINVTRIVGLWYSLRYFPSTFDTMHIIVGQTALIVVGGAFFAVWSGALGAPRVQRT